MVLAQLRKARVQAVERQAVRRQHQRIARQRLETREQIQILLHRIGVRLRRGTMIDGVMCESTWSPAIRILSFSQKYEACSGEWPPAVMTRHSRLPMVMTSPSLMRVNSRGGRTPGNLRGRWAAAMRFGFLVARAVALHVVDEDVVDADVALVPHQPAVQPFGERQPRRAFVFLHEIAGEADVIDVGVGQGEVLQGPARNSPFHSLSQISKISSVFMPQSIMRPARTIVEQPAIDMVRASAATAAAPSTCRARDR